MTYEKPEVEVVKFEDTGFMTTSVPTYSNSTEALTAYFGGKTPTFNGNSGHFQIPDGHTVEGNHFSVGNYHYVKIGNSPNWRLCTDYQP